MDAPLARWPGSQAAHYENFPVGSWLLPARLRPAFAALYRFARYADDVADEGDASPQARLAELARLRAAVEAGARWPEAGPDAHPVVTPLLPFVVKHRLDRALLLALLSAFEQDVRVTRYADTPALRDYCRRSAEPVGRLVLQLFGVTDRAAQRASDQVCTALQLVNFLQDVATDWRKGRLYLPLDALQAAGLTPADVACAVDAGRAPAALRAVIAAQARAAHASLEAGRVIVHRVPVRLGAELRLVVAGGTQALRRLEAVDHDPIARRPALGWRDAPAIVALALRPVPRVREALA